MAAGNLGGAAIRRAAAHSPRALRGIRGRGGRPGAASPNRCAARRGSAVDGDGPLERGRRRQQRHPHHRRSAADSRPGQPRTLPGAAHRAADSYVERARADPRGLERVGATGARLVSRCHGRHEHRAHPRPHRRSGRLAAGRRSRRAPARLRRRNADLPEDGADHRAQLVGARGSARRVANAGERHRHDDPRRTTDAGGASPRARASRRVPARARGRGAERGLRRRGHRRHAGDAGRAAAPARGRQGHQVVRGRGDKRRPRQHHHAARRARGKPRLLRRRCRAARRHVL